MYGQPPPFRSGGGGRGAAQPPQQQQIHLNPNLFPNPNLFLLQQNPNFLSHLNPFVQNLNSFAQLQQQFPTSSFPVQLNSDNNNFQTPRPNGNINSKYPQQIKVQNEMVEKLDKAVMRARADLLASNENVSAWKVSQAALLMVKAESWESLGIQIQQVPSLNRLLATEGKINAFIHCFVAVRRITSLYDLEGAICENEGVERFEELELGPLVRHPLAIHYFSVTSDMTEVCRIRTEDIISYLCEFIDSHKKKEVKVDTFLDFISKKQSISGWEKLCVRVQNFGYVIFFG
ncbi:UNVERIFIED_CONTAM: Protein NO VEIN [Sesamum indicum]